MIDIKWIRQNPELLDASLKNRTLEPIATKILSLDEKKRQLQGQLQELQHAKNQKSSAIGQLAAKKDPSLDGLKAEVSAINKKIEELSASLQDDELDNLLQRIPNLLQPDVPLGKDHEDNVLVRSFGEPRNDSHAVRHHQDIGCELNILDFKRTAEFCGSRFASGIGDLARLERALANFLLDHNKQFGGFLEVSPPYLVKEVAMYNAGILPKFSDESFTVEDKFRLIPTAEVPLVNLFTGQTIAAEKMPLRLTAHTPCFRKEAGSAGADTKGLIRMHQFAKVELVSITTPDESKEELEHILSTAEQALKKLGLPFRTMLLCSGDTGFQSSKTYDIEVWMPSQGKYREISSCSNCTDFQARRMRTKYKARHTDAPALVHTLNGSSLPIGRTIAAILENYQINPQEVKVPECLVSYMGGQEKITINQGILCQ